MRRLMRPALLLTLVAVATLPAIADKAKDLYAKGEDAEARQQYEAAYDFFKQAYELKPKELRYRAAFEHVRFEPSGKYVVTFSAFAPTATPPSYTICATPSTPQLPDGFLTLDSLGTKQRLTGAGASCTAGTNVGW